MTSACWLSFCLARLNLFSWYIVRLGPPSPFTPLTDRNKLYVWMARQGPCEKGALYTHSVISLLLYLLEDVLSKGKETQFPSVQCPQHCWISQPYQQGIDPPSSCRTSDWQWQNQLICSSIKLILTQWESCWAYWRFDMCSAVASRFIKMLIFSLAHQHGELSSQKHRWCLRWRYLLRVEQWGEIHLS